MTENFFEQLYSSDDFCAATGRATLASSRLEVAIKTYLRHQGFNVPDQSATLGRLVTLLKDHDFITSNGEAHFKDLKIQRNYLIHSLFDLLAGNIPKTILENENLVPLDVLYFTEKAIQTANNISHFANLFEEAISGDEPRSPVV